MLETNSSSLMPYIILLIEICFVLVVLLVVFIVFTIINKKKEKKSLIALVDEIKVHEEDRITHINDFLRTGFNYAESDLSKTREELMEIENKCYRDIISIFMNRKHDDMHKIYSSIQELVDSYHHLKQHHEDPEAGLREALSEPSPDPEPELITEIDTDDLEEEVDGEGVVGPADEKHAIAFYQAKFMTYLESKGLNSSQKGGKKK